MNLGLCSGLYNSHLSPVFIMHCNYWISALTLLYYTLVFMRPVPQRVDESSLLLRMPLFLLEACNGMMSCLHQADLQSQVKYMTIKCFHFNVVILS